MKDETRKAENSQDSLSLADTISADIQPKKPNRKYQDTMFHDLFSHKSKLFIMYPIRWTAQEKGISRL